MMNYSRLALNPYGGKKVKSVAETTQPNNLPDEASLTPPTPPSKFHNMLKNPLFWPSVCLVIILSVITSGFFLNIHISWATIWDFMTDDKTWAKFGVIVAGIVGVVALVNEKLKSMRERADATSERVGLVEKTTEVISRATYDIQKFIDDIQEENKKYWVQLNEALGQLQEVREDYNASQSKIIHLEEQLAELRGQSRQDKDKIASLEAQITILQAQSIADKQTIAGLQSQVNTLRAELDRTKAESDRVIEENKELRTIYGRRSTDKLPGLSPEAEARFSELQKGENI